MHFWPRSHDQHDLAVLHDALKLRLRFGQEAESYCQELIEAGAASPNREEAIRELAHALELLPDAVPTYREPASDDPLAKDR